MFSIDFTRSYCINTECIKCQKHSDQIGSYDWLYLQDSDGYLCPTCADVFESSMKKIIAKKTLTLLKSHKDPLKEQQQADQG